MQNRNTPAGHGNRLFSESNILFNDLNHEVFKTESARSSSNRCETLERIGEIKLMMKFYLCLHNFSELFSREFPFEIISGVISGNCLYLKLKKKC